MSEFDEQVQRLSDDLMAAGYRCVLSDFQEKYEVWCKSNCPPVRLEIGNHSVQAFVSVGMAGWLNSRPRAVNESEFTDLIAAITK